MVSLYFHMSKNEENFGIFDFEVPDIQIRHYHSDRFIGSNESKGNLKFNQTGIKKLKIHTRSEKFWGTV